MVLTENILIRKETMMQIQNINEKSFKKYGKILTGYHAVSYTHLTLPTIA